MDTRTIDRLVTLVILAILGLGLIITGIVLNNDYSNTMIGSGALWLLGWDICRSTTKPRSGGRDMAYVGPPSLWVIGPIALFCGAVCFAAMLNLPEAISHRHHVITAILWLAAIAGLDGLVHCLFKLPRGSQ